VTRLDDERSLKCVVLDVLLSAYVDTHADEDDSMAFMKLRDEDAAAAAAAAATTATAGDDDDDDEPRRRAQKRAIGNSIDFNDTLPLGASLGDLSSMTGINRNALDAPMNTTDVVGSPPQRSMHKSGLDSLMNASEFVGTAVALPSFSNVLQQPLFDFTSPATPPPSTAATASAMPSFAAATAHSVVGAPAAADDVATTSTTKKPATRSATRSSSKSTTTTTATTSGGTASTADSAPPAKASAKKSKATVTTNDVRVRTVHRSVSVSLLRACVCTDESRRLSRGARRAELACTGECVRRHQTVLGRARSVSE
jgi:hypothetical protein